MIKTPPTELLSWATFLKDTFTFIAVIIGGSWTIIRFGLNRERFAKIQFNLDLVFLSKVNGKQIIELVAIVENKGLVRQKIKDWTFDLLYLSESDAIDTSSEEINYQVKFTKAISKRRWVPASWNYTFIDGGTLQTYTYLTTMPVDAKLLILNSRFIYPGGGDFHSAQKTFIVPETISNEDIKWEE